MRALCLLEAMCATNRFSKASRISLLRPHGSAAAILCTFSSRQTFLCCLHWLKGLGMCISRHYRVAFQSYAQIILEAPISSVMEKVAGFFRQEIRSPSPIVCRGLFRIGASSGRCARLREPLLRSIPGAASGRVSAWRCCPLRLRVAYAQVPTVKEGMKSLRPSRILHDPFTSGRHGH